MKSMSLMTQCTGLLIFALLQGCVPGDSKVRTEQPVVPADSLIKPLKKIYVPKETVTIYLTCIKQTNEKGDTTFRLAFFDANGDFGTDSLFTTQYYFRDRRPGHIKWRKVHESGIKKIVSIQYAGVDPPVIFKNGVNERSVDEWDLSLTEDILKSIGDSGKTEEYKITFIPEESDVPVPIDPYLRVTPTP